MNYLDLKLHERQTCLEGVQECYACCLLQTKMLIPKHFMLQAARFLGLCIVLGVCLESAMFAQVGGVPGPGGNGAGPGLGGFGGPAVLGRGAVNTPSGPSEAGFRFYVGVTGGYDTGLTGFALDREGNVQNSASVGLDGIAGVYGVKRMRRSLVSVNYQGGYRHYTNIKGFNGTDQNITLSASRQINARSAAGIGVSAGTTNRAFGLNSLNGFVDPNFLSFGLPTAEIFDNRIYYGNGSVNYIWQRSARGSLHVTGTGFITRRMGRVLFGANGASAGADYAYRLTRNQTVSVGYNYLFFNFQRGFGDSHGQGLYLGYAAVIARKYQLAFRGGPTRLENLFLRNVEVDPVIAAIVGVRTTQEVFHNVTIVPNGNVSFSGPVTRRSTFNLSSGLFVVPGNGVITTARNVNVGGSYSYTGLRRLGLGASVFYNRLSSAVGEAQQFSSVNSSLNVSPRLTNTLHLSLSAGNRRFLEGQTNGYRRNSYFAQFGLFWSPGELPLNFR